MYIFISPAKTMAKTLNLGDERCDNAYLPILNELKKLNKNEISKLYKCNDKIAEQTFQHIQDYKEEHIAILSYSGLQYKQLELKNLTACEQAYVGKNIRILSAFYGVLKPFERIAQYRLDFNVPIKVNGQSLYQYWQHTLEWTAYRGEVLSLASDEYNKMLDRNIDYVAVQFYIEKKGKYVLHATHSKISRGKFLNYCIKRNVQSIDEFRKIKIDGYAYDPVNSTESKIIFLSK